MVTFGDGIKSSPSSQTRTKHETLTGPPDSNMWTTPTIGRRLLNFEHTS